MRDTQRLQRNSRGDFGKWPGHVGEKVMRVLHILAAFTAALPYDQQRLLWYSDTDQINEDAKDRSFADTQKMFESIGAMYMTHGFDVLGFAKSFSEKGYLDDLPSVPDLAAGMLLPRGNECADHSGYSRRVGVDGRRSDRLPLRGLV